MNLSVMSLINRPQTPVYRRERGTFQIDISDIHHGEAACLDQAALRMRVLLQYHCVLGAFPHLKCAVRPFFSSVTSPPI